MDNLPDGQRPPRAYSYTRFSTPEQAKGDSQTRQTLAAQQWAEKHGVDLDSELSFQDAGVSAFDGSNVERGALGAFLKAVHRGEVPKGSWLLVESLDRISRQKPWKAAQLMASIAEEGVVVVDLSDGGREYSGETLNQDSSLLLMMVVRFMRANEESALKSSRVAAARKRAREAFASDQPLTKAYTKQLPAWLRWSDETKQIEAIPDRAEVVRKIFELADNGWGQHRIAGWLNDHAGEPWGRGKRKGERWHRSYVRKVLTNRAVIGSFTPHTVERDPNTHKRMRKPTDAIHHRFPPVIDRQLFDRVSSRIGSSAARGRHAGLEARSMFAGLLKCRHCGGTVTRVSKGEYAYLVCSTANSKPRTCRYEAMPYGEAEQAFIFAIPGTIHDAPRGKDTGDLEEQIRIAEANADGLFDQVEVLLEVSIEEKSAAARRALKEREQSLASVQELARNLRERRDRIASAGVLQRLEAIENILTQSPLNIPRANAVLRDAIERMVMFPPEGHLDVYWRHAVEPQRTTFGTSRVDWDANNESE